MVNSCGHKWSEPAYDPIVTEGYTDPGDPPGVGGIDHRNPMWVPGTETPRWRRTCATCGETQYTQQADKIEVRKPQFETRPRF